MAHQAGQNMIAVLPYRFGDHDRRIRGDVREDIHAHALVIDEAVLELRIVGMRAAQGESFGLESLGQLRFHLRLRGPADLIGR